MARHDLIEAFRSARTFSWRDFVTMLESMGYAQKKAGKTGGARRKYFNQKTGHLVVGDEPHNGVMQRGMVQRLRRDLRNGGVI